MNATKHTNSTIGGRARTALKVALAATVLTLGAVGASGNPAHAGSIVANANTRLFCGTGTLNMSLPVVQAYTSGFVFEVTVVQRHDGARWVDYSSTGARYASLGAGQYQNGAWIDLNSNQYIRSDAISVAPGAYYRLVHWVYADGYWINQPSPYCYA